MTARSILFCTASSLIAAALLAQDATQKDLDKLQGKWISASVETKGKDFTPKLVVVTYTITGSEYSSMAGDKKAPGNVAFRIDATKEPKTFDATGTEGKVGLGIYKLEGDTLTICRETGSGIRPTEFKTTAADGSLSVWKRASK